MIFKLIPIHFQTSTSKVVLSFFSFVFLVLTRPVLVLRAYGVKCGLYECDWAQVWCPSQDQIWFNRENSRLRGFVNCPSFSFPPISLRLSIPKMLHPIPLDPGVIISFRLTIFDLVSEMWLKSSYFHWSLFDLLETYTSLSCQMVYKLFHRREPSPSCHYPEVSLLLAQLKGAE